MSEAEHTASESLAALQSSTASTDPSQIQQLEPRELFRSVGQNCEVLDHVCNNLRAVVLELRRRGVTLNNRNDFNQAVQWIATGYEQPPGLDVLKRYARTLNNFLRMPPSQLPLKPILTGSYPRWYGKGDEVAVYDRGEWWHAVVIGDVQPRSKKVRIFWVGYDEHETGNVRIANLEDSLYQNPCYVSTNDIRSLSEMASPKAGSLADFGVSWIQGKYCGIADDAQESATSSSTKSAEGEHANAAACKAKKGKGTAAATKFPRKKKRKKSNAKFKMCVFLKF